MNRKKLVALIMVLALAFTTLVGGTLAYFTDTDDATNTFVMGNVDIELDEAPVEYNPEDYTWTPDTEAERVNAITFGDKEIGLVYPGAVLPKDPTVHNVGLNDAYIRIKVTINPYVLGHIMAHTESGDPLAMFMELVDIDTENWDYEADFKENVLDPENAKWTLVARYRHVLKPGEDTTPFFTEVRIPTELEDMYSFTGVPFDMDIVAEAIQAASFADADEAWNAFDGVEERPLV